MVLCPLLLESWAANIFVRLNLTFNTCLTFKHLVPPLLGNSLCIVLNLSNLEICRIDLQGLEVMTSDVITRLV